MMQGQQNIKNETVTLKKKLRKTLTTKAITTEQLLEKNIAHSQNMAYKDTHSLLFVPLKQTKKSC